MAKKLPELIQKKHVLAAARKWDEGRGYLTFRNSTLYDTLISGRRYPPKAICSLALYFANGAKMQSREFKGALDGPWQQRLNDLEFYVVPKSRTRPTAPPTTARADAVRDLKKLLASLKERALRGTEREAVVRQRLLTGSLRSAVLASLSARCCLTRLDDPRFLVASHIVPWSESSDSERVDLENLLLLSTNWDALFDRHLLSFNDDGTVVLSKALKKTSTLKKLGVDRKLVLDQEYLTPKRLGYLRIHRERTLGKA